jgi:hypothetical protein
VLLIKEKGPAADPSRSIDVIAPSGLLRRLRLRPRIIRGVDVCDRKRPLAVYLHYGGAGRPSEVVHFAGASAKPPAVSSIPFPSSSLSPIPTALDEQAPASERRSASVRVIPRDRDRADARSRPQQTFWSKHDHCDVSSASHQAACFTRSAAADEGLQSLMR